MYRIGSDAINRGMRLKDGTPLEERAEGWYAHFKQVQQEAEIHLSTVDTSADETGKEIARIERRLDVAQDTMNDEDIRKNYEKLRRLRVQLADLEKKQAKKRVSDEEMREAAHDVASLPESWQEMKLERKRRFISLVTEAIELETLTERWLRLRITWTPYFQHSVIDECYIFQHYAGKTWSDEEKAIVREHYPTASRAWLLEKLPARSWQSMTQQASKMSLPRTKRCNETDLPMNMSLTDKRIMDKYGLAECKNYGDHWWKTLTIVNRTPTCS